MSRKLCPSIGKLLGKPASLSRSSKTGSSDRPYLPQDGSSAPLTLYGCRQCGYVDRADCDGLPGAGANVIGVADRGARCARLRCRGSAARRNDPPISPKCALSAISIGDCEISSEIATLLQFRPGGQ